MQISPSIAPGGKKAAVDIIIYHTYLYHTFNYTTSNHMWRKLYKHLSFLTNFGLFSLKILLRCQRKILSSISLIVWYRVEINFLWMKSGTHPFKNRLYNLLVMESMRTKG